MLSNSQLYVSDSVISYTESSHIVEVHHVLLHCLAVPNLITFPTYTLSYYIAELFPILKQRWGTSCRIKLLSYSQS